jgi:hypothetical protein
LFVQDVEFEHTRMLLQATVRKRLNMYAIQWGGCLVEAQTTLPFDQKGKLWTWVLAFSNVANALRFAFSTQYALISEIWKREFVSIFPPTVQGTDGRIVFRGPRITMVVHTSKDARDCSLGGVNSATISCPLPPKERLHPLGNTQGDSAGSVQRASLGSAQACRLVAILAASSVDASDQQNGQLLDDIPDGEKEPLRIQTSVVGGRIGSNANGTISRQRPARLPVSLGSGARSSGLNLAAIAAECTGCAENAAENGAGAPMYSRFSNSFHTSKEEQMHRIARMHLRSSNEILRTMQYDAAPWFGLEIDESYQD